MSKLINILESGGTPNPLWDRFNAAQESPDFWNHLSAALGHDPDYEDDEDDGGDCLSPEDLVDDRGWAWDNVREQFLLGRGHDDPSTTVEVANALGIDTTGLDDKLEMDFEQFLPLILSRV